jgi:hypothetical protein
LISRDSSTLSCAIANGTTPARTRDNAIIEIHRRGTPLFSDLLFSGLPDSTLIPWSLSIEFPAEMICFPLIGFLAASCPYAIKITDFGQ